MKGASYKKAACRRRLLALAVASCFAGEVAYANPTGPVVARGNATFSTQGNVLTVTNSPGTIINWQGFSIPSQDITRFMQQSAASAVLNRVTGATPSAILGQLQSNGRVFLINPNGITIGQGAVIDVAGFVASSLNLSDSDFIAGRLKFSETPGAGAVVNRGEIRTATGGMVYLVGQNIENHGIIRSPKGEIVLAAGKSVELVDAGTPEIRVQITAPDNEVLNLGKLFAEGGRIGMYAGLIRHGGTANANTAVVGESGKIVFKAVKDVKLETGSVTSANGPTAGTVKIEAETGTATVTGVVEANATAGRGGIIEVSGQQGVTIAPTGRVSASGLEGGTIALSSGAGPVQVSGAVSAEASAGRGGRVAIEAATQASVAEGARVTASGAQAGGTVSVTGGASVKIENRSAIQANGASGGAISIGAEQGAVEVNGMIDALGGEFEGGQITVTALSDVTLGATSALTARGSSGGTVYIEAREGTTLAGGILDAFGREGPGGVVLLLGPRVGLVGNASINVSGRRGGGNALVGGDFQGSNPDVQNAERTYVGADASIAADSIESGDGGKVIIWADGDTRFHGTITARGGAQSGNGGFVEVSGKEILNFSGRVDVGALAGLAGTILLDPRDITIVDTGGSHNGQVAPTTDENIFFADGGTSDFTISDETLELLNGSIVLQATQDITINSGLSGGGLVLINQASGERVVLQAGRHIIINSPIKTNGAAIWLEADTPHSNGYPVTGTTGADGRGAVRINAAVQSFGADGTTTEANGGKITLIAGTNTQGGTNGGGFELNANVNAGAGGIDVALSSQVTGELSFLIGSEGQAQFTTADTGQLLSAGQLKIGEATTAGTNGLGANALTIKVDQLSIGSTAGGPVTLADTAGTSLVLTAGDGGILVDRPLSSDQPTSIETTGALTINQTLTTNGEPLSITAASISGADLVTGTGTITCSGTGCPGTTVIHWDGGGGDLNWFTAANWSGDVVPTSSDAVEMHTSSGTVVISGAAASVKSLIADVPIAISTTGSITLSEASQFTRGLTLSDAGSLLGTGVVAVSGNSGVLTWNGGMMGSGGSFTLGVGASGTLSGTLTLNRLFHNSSALTLSGVTLGGTGSLENAGTITAAISTANALNVALSNPANSLIQALGSLTASSFSSNGGQISVGSGGTFSTGGASLSNSATSSIVIDGGDFLANGVSVTTGGGNMAFDGALTAGRITLLASGGSVTLNAGSTITASGSDDSIVISGASLINNAGSAALDPGSGRFLVWSSNADPFGGGTPDNRGGLAYDFKQYNATYGSTTVLGAGNGFLYTLAPMITPTLQGAVTKTYDGTASAALASGNYATTGIGVVDGDTVTLSNPATGVFATKNVGIGILVTASSASSLTSASNGAAAVYGYQVSTSPASGNIGIINQAPLTVTAQTDNRVYNGTTSSGVAPMVSGTLYDAVGTAATQSYDTKNVGTGKTLTASGLVVNDGNSGNNYAITYVADTTGVITPDPGNFMWVAGSSGNWDIGANWNQGVVPVAGAVVTIPDIGAPGVSDTITYRSASGTTSIKSLMSAEALMVSGGTLNLGTVLADVSSVSHLTLAGGTLGAGGTLNLGTTSILAGGVLTGTGKIVGNVDNLAGTVAPGASPGTLTIDGNYTQGPGATLAIEIGGIVAGSQHDALAVSGNATLGGALDVALVNGFVPASGSSFTIIQAGTVSGQFASVSSPAAQPMTAAYLASSVALGTSQAGTPDQILSEQIQGSEIAPPSTDVVLGNANMPTQGTSGAPNIYLETNTGQLLLLNQTTTVQGGSYINLETGQTLLIESGSTPEPGVYLNQVTQTILAVLRDKDTGEITIASGSNEGGQVSAGQAAQVRRAAACR